MSGSTYFAYICGMTTDEFISTYRKEDVRRLAGSKAQIAVLGSRGWTYLSAAYFDGTVFERGNSEV